MQAKDITDRLILEAIEALAGGPAHWANKVAVYERIGSPPGKVFHAKLRAIKRRHLANGCESLWCGCTGWEVTGKGRELLASELAERIA